LIDAEGEAALVIITISVLLGVVLEAVQSAQEVEEWNHLPVSSTARTREKLDSSARMINNMSNDETSRNYMHSR
jgi:hypothetical protein